MQRSGASAVLGEQGREQAGHRQNWSDLFSQPAQQGPHLEPEPDPRL